MVLRLLIFVALIYAGAKAFLWVRRFMKSLPHRSEQRVSQDMSAVNDMVRDPVCGLYVTSEESLSAMVNGRKYHFCSVECRRKFIDDQG